MRRFNGWLALTIIILLTIHAVAGAFIMMGIISGGSTWLRILSFVMVALVCAHGFIGLWLTFSSFKADKETGYSRQNRLFWIRRISGVVMVLFIVAHLMIFWVNSTGAYRLKLFEGPQLVLSILLVVTVAVHLLSNVKPLMITLGTEHFRKILVDVLFVLAVVLALAAVAFVIYYGRWNLNWKV